MQKRSPRLQTDWQEEVDAFLRDAKAIHELHHTQRDNIFSFDDPGHLSGPAQQQVRDVIRRFGMRLPELVPA
jgi:hypothetical protein